MLHSFQSFTKGTPQNVFCQFCGKALFEIKVGAYYLRLHLVCWYFLYKNTMITKKKRKRKKKKKTEKTTAKRLTRLCTHNYSTSGPALWVGICRCWLKQGNKLFACSGFVSSPVLSLGMQTTVLKLMRVWPLSTQNVIIICTFIYVFGVFLFFFCFSFLLFLFHIFFFY